MEEMDANGTSFAKAQRNMQGLGAILKSAACEWFLLALMLFNAILSYFLTKFARYCKLQIPCILCSRLDHILGNEQPGFYRSLLCGKHRSEISSMVACHIHGKIADGRGMCEECLFSYILKAKPSIEMYRALLGIVGFDPGCHSFKGSFMNSDFGSAAVGTRLCSCCRKPWISGQNAHKLLHLRSPKPDIPLPRRLTHRENIKKMRGRFSGAATSCRLGNIGYDPMSYIGYSELKINSDSESEFPFSDNDEVSSVVPEVNDRKEDLNVEVASKAPCKTLTPDLSPEKLSHDSSKPLVQPDAGAARNAKCLASESDTGVGVGEDDWQQANQNHSSSVLPELILLDDFPPSNLMETPAGVSTKESEVKFPVTKKSFPSVISQLMSLAEAPSLFNVSRGAVEASEKKSDESGIVDFGNSPINKYEDFFKSVTTAGVGIKDDKVVNQVPPINPTHLSFTDVWKPSVHGKERDTSGFVNEKPMMMELTLFSEKLKPLPAEDAFGNAVHSSSAGNTSSMQGHDDELQGIDPSSSDGGQIPQESISVERTEPSGFESHEESSISEIECENIVDQLKRQIEHDRKRIQSLYMELEEERNASAIAANQAMAMITRLQEEKASLHMEALQYLRMMEEQAEYDVEALEKANDLLAEREKEIQDMEAELEFLRLKFSDESAAETIPNKNSRPGGKLSVENNGMYYAKDNAIVHPNSLFKEVPNGGDKNTKLPWSTFEDEKSFISESLKRLERKLRQFTSHPSSPCMSDSDHSEEMKNGGHDKEELLVEEDQINGNKKENNLSVQTDICSSNRSFPAEEDSSPSSFKDKVICSRTNHQVSNGQSSTIKCEGFDYVTLENELSDLNERLEALESDWHFLEHTVNSLQSGKGLQFIQEIAHQLQELRQIGLRSRCQSVH